MGSFKLFPQMAAVETDETFPALRLIVIEPDVFQVAHRCIQVNLMAVFALIKSHDD